MATQGDAPDAWDDDWETQADQLKPEEELYPDPAQPSSQIRQTRAERLAQHVEDNKKLWESACVAPSVPILASPAAIKLLTMLRVDDGLDPSALALLLCFAEKHATPFIFYRPIIASRSLQHSSLKSRF